MQILLAACERVTSFTYTTGGYIHGDNQFEPIELIAELEAYHLNTLEHLTLSFEYYEPDGDDGTVDDLFIFPNLKSLLIRLDDLIGRGVDGDIGSNEDEGDTEGEGSVKLVDVLPEAIEVLEVTDCDARIFQSLVNFAAERQERFQRLKIIKISMKSEEHVRENEEALRTVRSVFGEDDGVVVEFR
jgi:hypothetical protein